MKVPFLDLKAQYQSIKHEINPALQSVMDNTAFVLGKPVAEFEAAFARAHDVAHCVGLSSGTDGNHLVLWALGIKPGDEVIIPADTFIASVWGATLCGAKPVFVDCEPDSYNLDPGKLEAAITSKTKAIVVVHLYGQPADMDPIVQIAQKHNIYVVEDCAQSHIAEYKGRRVGGLSDAASFSFYPGKNLGAYGEAGAATTKNPELARKFRMMRDHGAENKYDHEIYGHNYRMEGFQGAVLGVKLGHLPKWTEQRRSAAGKYNRLLSGVGDIQIPKQMAYAKHVYHLYVIQTARRDELQKWLGAVEIGTGLHYPSPLHVQRCFKHLGYKEGDFPVAEKLAKNCLSLPMYPELSDDQISFVAESIRSFFK